MKFISKRGYATLLLAISFGSQTVGRNLVIPVWIRRLKRYEEQETREGRTAGEIGCCEQQMVKFCALLRDQADAQNHRGRWTFR
jgi:hypothetical protein